jgi:hypothetical protein
MKTNVNGYKMRFAADILEYGPKVAVTTPPREDTIEEEEFNQLTAD